jgi:NADH-quinone oxidoreductase subunit G
MDTRNKKQVTLTINGKEVCVPSGIYLTEAAELAGFHIPQFCSHRWLEPLGACRMCMVRIEKMPKLQTACSTFAQEGMVVTTESDEIRKAREEMLEFHLLNHPLECPVCDRGGECELQDLTLAYGLAESRYTEPKLELTDTMLTPFLHMNYKRCILCKRCVRYCDEITGSHLLQVDDRGAWSHITTYNENKLPDYFSGNTIEICPVGAITSQLFRFRGRPWELVKTRTICAQCSVGCNVELHSRDKELLRVVPAPNVNVDDGHICDRGRFAYEYANMRDFTKPLSGKGVERREVSWEDAEETVAARFKDVIEKHGANAIGLIAGAGMTNEEYIAFRLFAHSHIGTDNFFVGEGLIDVRSNPQLLLHSLFFDAASVDEIIHSDAVINIGCDLCEEAPVLGLRLNVAQRKEGVRVISLSPHFPRGYWSATEEYLYDPGNFLAAAGEILRTLEEGSFTGKWASLAEALVDSPNIAILYGQDILYHPNADKCLLALLKIKYAAYKLRAGRGIVGHISLNPVFRSANSTGAMVFNFLEFLVRGEENAPKRPHATMRGILEKAAAGEIKLLYLVNVNPLMTFVDRGLVERALAACEFVIAESSLPNETSDAADMVLPVSPPVCREGTFINAGWRLQKLSAMEMNTARPSDLEVWARLMIKLGKGSHSTSAAKIFDEVAKVTPLISHLTFETIPAAGSNLDFQMSTEDRKRISAEIDSLHIDFAHAILPEGYPFVLVPKKYLFRNSPRMRFSPAMAAVTPDPAALLNLADIARLGLKAGQAVSVESRNGAITLPLEAAEWVQPGSVVISDYIPGAPVNKLISVDDEVTAVRVVPA